MIEKWVKAFVEFQTGIGVIQDDDVSVYQYGYTVMIEVLLNTAISFVLGVLLGQIKEVCFFLCMFIPLRSFCGGYHATKAWQCAILSNLSVIGALVLSEMLTQYRISPFVYIIGEICIGSVIAYYSPVESVHKKLNVEEQKIYRKYVTKILMVEMVAAIVFLISGSQKMFNVIFFVHIIQGLSLLKISVGMKFQI
ncbi:hypothetical protein D7V82_10420 [bacterium 1xD8-6]|nr:hypothetical protein D7V72_13015 [bacterium D16-36]RKI68976.1 hypothetical protein D7V82_10420 [bacterium 1xD8-6]